MKVLEEAAGSAKKMSCHNEADDKVSSLKVITYILFSSALKVRFDLGNSNKFKNNRRRLLV